MNYSPEAVRVRMINYQESLEIIRIMEYGRLLEIVENHWENKLFEQGPQTLHRNLSGFPADALGLPRALSEKKRSPFYLYICPAS